MPHSTPTSACSRSAAENRNRRGLHHCLGRWFVLGLGFTCLALGLVGVVVPGLPTTVFLLVALWAFSRSSERFQTWLWTHPRLGPPLQTWHKHRAIPRKGKIAAVLTMTASLAVVAATANGSWVEPAVLAAVMLPVAVYIVTRAAPPLEEVSPK